MAKETYDFLVQESTRSKLYRPILNAVDSKISLLQENPNHGRPISKRLIPNMYREKFGITNLFWVSLPQYWRMLYSTLTTENNLQITAMIIEIIDHPKYDKRFGYEKK